MIKKNVCILLCVAVLCSSLFPARAAAQNGQDIGKDLLRALIESQLEKSRRKNGGPNDPFRDPQGNGNLRPGQTTQEMQKLRPITASFAQESATLTALLNSDARRSFKSANNCNPRFSYRRRRPLCSSNVKHNHITWLCRTAIADSIMNGRRCRTSSISVNPSVLKLVNA